jgi:hypothetical protein
VILNGVFGEAVLLRPFSIWLETIELRIRIDFWQRNRNLSVLPIFHRVGRTRAQALGKIDQRQ